MGYFSLFADKIRKKAADFFDSVSGDVPEGVYPKAEAEEVGGWAEKLFEDALSYRNERFSETLPEQYNYSDPVEFWKTLARLESGDHWGVWGHRNTGVLNKWKQEITDDEISDQIRARKANLTANWHDVQVSPNIAYINEILDQERRTTGWGKTVRRIVGGCEQFGFVWVESFLDKTKDTRGIANQRVMQTGALLLSPHSAGKEVSEGCWYDVHPQMVTGQWVRDNYPDFDLKDIPEYVDKKDGQEVTTREYGKGYKHTKLYPLLEFYMDDPELEDQDALDPEEFDLRIGNLQMGQDAPAGKDDNHGEYIKAYQSFAESKRAEAEGLEAQGQMDPTAKQRMADILDVVSMQIDEHARAEKQRGLPLGKRKKYPNGRHIVTIANKVAEDKPSMYEFDWRKLVHYIPNEEVPDRLEGRSDVEILWNPNKELDQAKSRFADAAVLGAHTKWFHHIDDLKSYEEHPEWFSTDPLNPGFYTHQPPTGVKSAPPTEYLKQVEMVKQDISRKLGITQVTYGSAPTANASGDLAQTLLQQNQTLISGELNQNLADGIEDITETALLIMRQFYTEPRLYMVQGVQRAVTLSEQLSYTMVGDGESQEKREITSFQVAVRPESNFPGRWERETAIISNLMMQVSQVDPAKAIALSEKLMDMMGERFPDLGKNGEYRQLSPVIQAGQQAIAQQQMVQQAQEQDAQAIDAQKRKFQAEQLKGAA